MPDFDFIEDADLRAKAVDQHKIEVDKITIDFTNSTKTQVEEAVTGLKTKNTEILGEKKALQDNLKLFGDLDPKTAKTANDFYEKNKDAEFLKDGTVEELIEKKTSQLTSDFETQITEINGKLASATEHGATYQTLFESKVIDDGLRVEAVKQGVRNEALEDVVMRGRSVFSLDENKQIEARDAEGKLAVIDKKVMTTKNWIEGLKDTSPHYWPESEGAGAHGGSTGGDTDYHTKLNDLATKGDMKGFRALRAKHNEAKK